MEIEENKKIYEALYAGGPQGDSWTLAEDITQNPRKRAVLDVWEKFNGPVSILDIGCGKGLNTKWITSTSAGSSWVGVDIVSKEKIGIDISDSKQKFFEGDIRNEEFRKGTGIEYSKFEIIVDQGATFVELDSSAELESYLKLVHSLLSENGVFIALTIIGEPETIIFADGRKRVIRAKEDFINEPVCKYFEIDNSTQIDSIAHNKYSYPVELKSASGENIRLQIAQILLKKKLII